MSAMKIYTKSEGEVYEIPDMCIRILVGANIRLLCPLLGL